jgi:hypothetical protein
MTGNGVLRAIGLMDLVDVTQTAGHGRYVNGRVATANHYDALAHMTQATVVESLQEGRCGDAIGGLRTFHGQCPTGLRAQPQENGIIFSADLHHADVGSDPAVQAGLDAEVKNALDLGIKDVAWRAKARDAVSHHAAKLRALVKKGHVVAPERELVGSGQAGRAATDHGDRLAGLHCRLWES